MLIPFSAVPEKVKTKIMTDQIFRITGTRYGGTIKSYAAALTEFEKVRTELCPDAKKYMVDSEDVAESIRKWEAFRHG